MYRWNNGNLVISNRSLYDISLILNNNTANKRIYKLEIDGTASDPDLSNLPMNISNTVLIPNDFI